MFSACSIVSSKFLITFSVVPCDQYLGSDEVMAPTAPVTPLEGSMPQDLNPSTQAEFALHYLCPLAGQLSC